MKDGTRREDEERAESFSLDVHSHAIREGIGTTDSDVKIEEDTTDDDAPIPRHFQ